jgi:hypothetical protein
LLTWDLKQKPQVAFWQQLTYGILRITAMDHLESGQGPYRKYTQKRPLFKEIFKKSIFVKNGFIWNECAAISRLPFPFSIVRSTCFRLWGHAPTGRVAAG